jgi:hypothetical protein
MLMLRELTGVARLMMFCSHILASLIAKWKKPGYEKLCCVRCIQTRVCRSFLHLKHLLTWLWYQGYELSRVHLCLSST